MRKGKTAIKKKRHHVETQSSSKEEVKNWKVGHHPVCCVCAQNKMGGGERGPSQGENEEESVQHVFIFRNGTQNVRVSIPLVLVASSRVFCI